MFIAACETLLRTDMAHVPNGPGESLYLRPFMIATEASISVRAAQNYLFCVIASPAGSFFSPGTEGINAWCSAEYVRAAAGGTGEAKCAGNYAASLIAKAQAAKHRCQEVVWLDALEHRWVEELSAMNFFCVFIADGFAELVTPPLSGTILDGNTRDSILQLARRRGIRTAERPVALADLTSPAGGAVEAFASVRRRRWCRSPASQPRMAAIRSGTAGSGSSRSRCAMSSPRSRKAGLPTTRVDASGVPERVRSPAGRHRPYRSLGITHDRFHGHP